MTDDAAVLTAPETTTAPVETPSTATTEVTTPAVTNPTTPAEPAKGSEEALRAAVGRQMDKVPGFELTKPVETKTPEQLAEEKTEADRKAAETVKTPEQVAAEQKAAEEKAAADKAALEAKAEPNPLDKLGPLPVETLAKAITENPALAAELEKSGIDSELLYETSRRAALTDQFQEIFPTPDAAKFAGESAQHFYDIEESFPKIQNVEDIDKFITNTMLPLSTLYGTDGKPLMTADGKGYQTDGSIARFFDATTQFETINAVRAADVLLDQYKNVTGEEGERLKGEAQRIREALILSQEFRDNGYRLPGTKPQPGTRSPEDQRALDEAARIKAEAEKATHEARSKEDKAYQDSVFTEAGNAVKSFVQSTLELSSLNDNEKRFIAEKAMNESWSALGKNRHYQAQKEHLYSLGNTPENKAALVSLTKTAFQTEATKVMRRLVEESGGKYISRQQKKLEKIDSQKANDRMNQGSGTTASAKTPSAMTSTQVRAKAIENLKARGVTTPDDGDILTETLTIRNLRPTA